MSEVIILGSGTCVPSAKRAGPGTCLVTDELIILIDSASGTLRQLVRAGIPFDSLDALFYTHLHPDHVAELVPLLFASKYSPAYHREKPVTIFAAQGFQDFLESLKKAYGSWIEPDAGKIVVRELPTGVTSSAFFASVQIVSAPTKHTPQSLGYRIEAPDGKAAVFSGDTDYCEELIELASGADLLVCECAAPEEHKIPGHLVPSEAGRIAQAANVRKLLLTHFYPDCDEHDLITPCREFYGGPVVLAQDFMRLTL